MKSKCWRGVTEGKPPEVGGFLVADPPVERIPPVGSNMI